MCRESGQGETNRKSLSITTVGDHDKLITGPYTIIFFTFKLNNVNGFIARILNNFIG